MNIKVEPGHYIVAVSGGVDSVTLLDILRRKPGLKLTAAHYDHGIRPDSKKDRFHVQGLAKKYRLPFVYQAGNLGPAASEAEARQARYEFLRSVQKNLSAKAIITAHHQDDVLETAIHNILRGTGRKGISAMNNNLGVVRPMLNISKANIKEYALANGLVWREDSTNEDLRYRRNFIRSKIIPKLSSKQREEFLGYVNKLSNLNKQIDVSLINYLHQQPKWELLDRHSFIMLPHKVSLEVMASWLRNHNARDFDKPLLERLVVKSKILAPAKRVDVNHTYTIQINSKTLALQHRDR